MVTMLYFCNYFELENSYFYVFLKKTEMKYLAYFMLNKFLKILYKYSWFAVLY